MSRKRIHGLFEPCSVEGCRNGIHAAKLCAGHYSQQWRGLQFSAAGLEALGCSPGAEAKVEREISDGVRCRCGLLKPCVSCVPGIDGFAEMRRER